MLYCRWPSGGALVQLEMSRTSRDQTNHNFIGFSFILLTVLNREEGGEETHVSATFNFFFGKHYYNISCYKTGQFN